MGPRPASARIGLKLTIKRPSSEKMVHISSDSDESDLEIPRPSSMRRMRRRQSTKRRRLDFDSDGASEHTVDERHTSDSAQYDPKRPMSPESITEPQTQPNLSELCSELETMIEDKIEPHLVENPDLPNDELDAAERAVDQIQTRLMTTASLLKQQRNRRTPIGRLTDDVILEILQYCDFDRLQDHSFSAIQIPPAFTLCSKWRNVAINAPSLWVDISLPLTPEFFDIFLHRSGNSPLNVNVSNTQIPEDEDEEDEGDAAIDDHLRAPLRRVIPRIGQLKIIWKTGTGRAWILTRFLEDTFDQTELPSLTLLDIVIEDTDYFEQSDKSLIAMNTPRLQEFRFAGYLPFMPLVSAESVTRLVYDSTFWIDSPSQISNLLSKFPNLEQCTIDSDPKEVEDTGTCVAVSANKLKSAEIGTLYLSAANDFLTKLQMPVVASFSLKITHGNEPLPAEGVFEELLKAQISWAHEMEVVNDEDGYQFALRSKLGRQMKITYSLPESTTPGLSWREEVSFSRLAEQSNNLSTLALCLDPLPPMDHLTAFLHSSSSLTHIRITTSRVDFPAFLKALESPEILCPLLTSIDCTGINPDMDRVCQFLDLRKRLGVPLKEVKISKDYSIQVAL
ncbi:hypothetical protein SISNIDRAFT_487050 [Sistotremastrum niveocremeum HHB9708]|uniref:F-box domain-containing protein n=1 Tax=Sistotremastrum niveocremeum HHB9708 TaxID=1314777 RepID=A0A164SRK6_9AGAM|nr:hypothetical protein SISNIDRAFT_487050 [Sistotremastrum niveocremeum HHB9708]